MASKKIVQHHERTTIAAALTDAQSREIVAGADAKRVAYKWANGDITTLNPMVFNVLDYGAKGDGVTDDTAAIQAADTAAAVNGGTVVFFPGTYIQSGDVTTSARTASTSPARPPQTMSSPAPTSGARRSRRRRRIGAGCDVLLGPPAEHLLPRRRARAGEMVRRRYRAEGVRLRERCRLGPRRAVDGRLG